MKRSFLSYLFLILTFSAKTQDVGRIIYPFPVKKITLNLQDSVARMVYMDESPVENANGKTVLLLHGKNFSAYYWQDVMKRLITDGFRVVAPDQVGWGHSDKPVITYSFNLLAKNNAILLDSLRLGRVIVVGHSMGGMLAARFALEYPGRVDKLVLENPIGLEDYRQFVPSRTTDQVEEDELKATYASYKSYQQTYYPAWKPEYEQYVEAQAESLGDPDFPKIARVNALTYQMIIDQPVCHEWAKIKTPTLLIIGAEDRTVVGKKLLNEEQKKRHGQYPELARKTQRQLQDARLVLIPGVGHIPHIQETDTFYRHLIRFIGD